MTISKNEKIYLDYQATAPIDPRVLNYMVECWTTDIANPSSKHYSGRRASDILESERNKIANLLNVKPGEIIFTSGATESINLLIKGLAEGLKKEGRHIITSRIEHKAVLDSCRYLENQGFDVTYLDVDTDGIINTSELKSSIRPDTILIAIHHGNNEIGVLQPIEEIGEIASFYGIHFFSDTVQTVGKVPVTTNKLDSLAISAHKVYGPTGVGCLWFRSKWLRSMIKQTHGGSQEQGLRPGTHNVPGIAGMAKALEISFAEMEFEQQETLKLRTHLQKELKEHFDDITFHGTLNNRLAGNLNFSISGISNELILRLLSDRFAFSAGSACTSESNQPSHVITALGKSRDVANGAIRISLGRYTNENSMRTFINEFINTIKKVKEITQF